MIRLFGAAVDPMRAPKSMVILDDLCVNEGAAPPWCNCRSCAHRCAIILEVVSVAEHSKAGSKPSSINVCVCASEKELLSAANQYFRPCVIKD